MTADIVRVDLVAGARPNFMKVAPLYHALAAETWCRARIIHTGQHYDAEMSDGFLRDLRLPAPDVELGIGSGTHAEQTARVMLAYEQTCFAGRPDWIVVVGDINSTLACALVGAKLGIPVAHLEAGLRSGDRSMPEEINRIVTDAVSDLLWTPSGDANQNLLHEGIAQEKIDRVGNIMIDSFELLADPIRERGMADELKLPRNEFAVVTLHRPSNVDQAETLEPIVDLIVATSRELPIVFPVHPRTRRRLETFGLQAKLMDRDRIHLLPPLGYIDFMSLVTACRLVVTDSGGVQEETSYLGIPCLTLRDSTERPVTVSLGTNRLVRAEALLQAVQAAAAQPHERPRIPLWDGRTAQRVALSLRERATIRGAGNRTS
jgi:UDP-N-acetylglucosamine 2-epimerase (non-hydrolysing)